MLHLKLFQQKIKFDLVKMIFRVADSALVGYNCTLIIIYPGLFNLPLRVQYSVTINNIPFNAVE